MTDTSDKLAPTQLLAQKVGGIIGLIEPQELEAAINLHMYTEQLKSVVKELHAQAKAKVEEALEYDRLNGGEGEVNVGTVRFYIGATKTTKPSQPMPAMLERIMDETHGDFDAVARCLSSSAFKPGQTKAEVGDAVFDELFAVTYPTDVKTGKPKKGLKVIDTRFMP